MTKVLACGDVIPGCEGVVRAKSQEELMPLVIEHVSSVHGITEIDAETVTKVTAAIRDE